MFVSFVATFSAYIFITFYAFSKRRYSNGFALLNLIIITLLVGLREFGYDLSAYKRIYEVIIAGGQYGIDFWTKSIIYFSDAIGFGYKGFLIIYAFINFSLIFLISKIERVDPLVYLSTYCIFVFGTSPLSLIRSSVAALFFALFIIFWFRRRFFYSICSCALAILFHSIAIVGLLAVGFIAFIRSSVGSRYRLLTLLSFLAFSTVVHLVVMNPAIIESVGSFSSDEYILFLFGKVATYHEYVWLDFTSLVHYFILLSTLTQIICYYLLMSRLRLSGINNFRGLEDRRQAEFIIDITKFALVFNLIGFLTFNLVWGTRVMEFFIPLLALLVARYGSQGRHFPYLVLFGINLIYIFLGYMSSLNWRD